MLEKRDKDLTIETFFRQEYQGLYRYIYSLISRPDDSLDVVQEAFLRFCRLARDGEVRQVEQIDRLTSGLFAGTGLPAGDSGETAARDLLAALRRLESRLESLLSVVSK